MSTTTRKITEADGRQDLGSFTPTQGGTMSDATMELEAWVRDGRPDWLPEKAVREYADWVGFEYAVETVEEAFNGQWGSEEEFAWDLADNLGYLDGPKYFRPPYHYFDIEAFTRDLFCGDYFMTASGYVFRSM